MLNKECYRQWIFQVIKGVYEGMGARIKHRWVITRRIRIWYLCFIQLFSFTVFYFFVGFSLERAKLRGARE